MDNCQRAKKLVRRTAYKFSKMKLCAISLGLQKNTPMLGRLQQCRVQRLARWPIIYVMIDHLNVLQLFMY